MFLFKWSNISFLKLKVVIKLGSYTRVLTVNQCHASVQYFAILHAEKNFARFQENINN